MTPVVRGLTFAEGLRWRAGRLWWSDMHAEVVQSWVPGDEAPQLEASVPGRPSGLGWLPDGRLLISVMMDRRLLRREPDGALVEHADLSAVAPRRINDMVVDAQGRAYVGNYGFNFEEGEAVAPTPLILVEADGRARPVGDPLLFPNGAVITPDGRTLIVAETWGARLSAFDVAPEGTLSGRRLWAQLPFDMVPDGICLDGEGAVWLASPTGRACLRVREGGEVAATIPCTRPAFTCVLGGPDGQTLYIATGVDHDRDRRRAARDGDIQAVGVEVAAA